MNETTRELADMMLDLGTFELRPQDPVRWASGFLMPVYNDNRRLMSYPQARALVARGLAGLTDRWADEIDGVVGTATAGIAPATVLADQLATRLYYVRSGAKDHGLGRRLEGTGSDPVSGRVVVVDDVVSTGGSTAAAASAVHDAGFEIICGLTVFSYGFGRSAEMFSTLPFHFEVFAIVTLNDLLERAAYREALSDEEQWSIRGWLADPFAWGATREAVR